MKAVKANSSKKENKHDTRQFYTTFLERTTLKTNKYCKPKNTFCSSCYFPQTHPKKRKTNTCFFYAFFPSHLANPQEKHVFDLVAAVPVATNPPPSAVPRRPPLAAGASMSALGRGPSLPRTRLSVEPLQGVVMKLGEEDGGWC